MNYESQVIPAQARIPFIATMTYLFEILNGFAFVGFPLLGGGQLGFVLLGHDDLWEIERRERNKTISACATWVGYRRIITSSAVILGINSLVITSGLGRFAEICL